MSTSPGYPYSFDPRRKDGKEPFLHRQEDGEVVLDEQLRRDVLRDVVNLRSGVLPFWVSLDIPKDEVRSGEAWRAGKTRYVYPITVRAYIVECMYFGSFIQWLKCMCPFGFSMVGTDAPIDFHRTILYLNQPGWKFIAGDFVGFDLLLPRVAQVFIAALANAFYSQYGSATSADNDMRIQIMKALTRIVHLMQGVLFTCNYGTCSGHAATAEFNSVVTYFLIYTCFCKHFSDRGLALEQIEDLWRDSVRLAIYGDDHIISVGPEAQSFSQKVVQSLIRDIYGIGYTSPDKSLDLDDFTTMEDLSFLKRRFRLENGHWNAYIPVGEARKRLFYWDPSCGLSKSNYLHQVYSSLLEEAAYCDEETFEAEKTRASTCLQKLIREDPFVGKDRADFLRH